jgi:hypothetical protein
MAELCQIEGCTNLRRGKLCNSHYARNRKYGDPLHGVRQSIYGGSTSQKKDGRVTSPIYKTWTNMKTRCYNPNVTEYKDYGERGIKVCERWLYNVRNFIDDMEESYFLGATIERIDVNGDYTPENCIWATWETQQNNRRSNRFLEYNNELLTVAQWSKRLGINSTTIRQRIDTYKWSIDKTLTTPARKRI